MKTLLKEFQADTVARLAREVRLGRREFAEGGRRQAIVLSSTTGSGKTLMATALMETLLRGDADQPGDPDATFLWISDDPSLNEQTRRRVVDSSDVLDLDSVVVVDNSFEAERLRPGTLYFVNTQKLSRTSRLTSTGDARAITFWETVANTVRESSSSFLAVIDEAHRGTTLKRNEALEARTIVQKFVLGSEETPPVSLLLGLSATPERFLALASRTQAGDLTGELLTRKVPVSVDTVRESGLIKDGVLLYYPETAAESDWTLLREAARTYRDVRDRWAAYSREQGMVEPVRPILVVQVEDGTARLASKTDLLQVLSVLEAEIGPLGDAEVAHAFQEGTSVTLDGDRALRRVAPPDIQDDQDLAVVLFKTSLNTGWDCPRAEVMMSFRTAKDYTSIAQLVGRMVRTPLARRVLSDNTLNAVSLYLPDYDRRAVAQVIEKLRDPGEDGVGPDVHDGRRALPPLARRPGTEHFFAKAATLPCYRITPTPKQPNLVRLVSLGRNLAQDGLRDGALDEAVDLVVSALVEETTRAEEDSSFIDLVGGVARFDLRAVTLRFGTEVELGDPSLERSAILHDANVDDLFAACDTRLGRQGLHLAYLRRRTADGVERAQVKRELFALLTRPSALDKANEHSGTRIREWSDRYRSDIAALPEARRAVYAAIRQKAVNPEPYDLVLPDELPGAQAEHTWPKHLYASEDGSYPYKPGSGWERNVLETVRDDPAIKAWFRNPVRRPYSLSVNFGSESGDANMYPDFLLFREQSYGVHVDILEPHRFDEGDAPSKVRGLAEYAAKHGEHYRRIEFASADDRGRFRRIDLNDEGTRAAARGVNSAHTLLTVLNERGYD